MKATIEIEMDNAAFAESAGAELARIIRDLAKHIESGEQARVLHDSNGNRVGTFKVTP